MTDTQRLDLLIVSLWSAGFILPAELTPTGFAIVNGQLIKSDQLDAALALAPDSTGTAADGAAGSQA